jgi:hypothetical protein
MPADEPTNGEHDRPVRESDRAEQEQAKRRHIVYSVFFCLLYTVLDVIFIFPDSHFLALVSLGLAFGFIAWAEVPRGYTLASVFSCVLASLVAYGIVGPTPPAETEAHGWIYPANEAPAETACPSTPWGVGANLEDPDRVLIVALGHSGVVIPYLPLKPWDIKENAIAKKLNYSKRTILTVGDCKAIQITRTEDGISIDADVFDSAGNLSARITNNEFHLISGQISYGERPDPSTLIVHDKQGNELFWLRYLNRKSVKLRGFFACKSHAPVQIGEDSITLPQQIHMTNGCMRSGTPESQGIAD